uniref:Immunoglobulin subtype domain-containing protein n=1 Tax=Sinocyclocheilus grahami TaxID=75366 RepID=A0A672L1M4_SINGR
LIFLYYCLSLSSGVVGDDVVTMSVMEGDSVALYSGVTKQQRDKMLWYINDTLIALINGEPSKSCVYYGEGEIFRDRLEVDYATGSLTIKNIRPEHTGRYEANFIQSKSSGTSQSLNRNRKCDGTKIIKKMSNIGDSVKTFSVSVTGKSFSALAPGKHWTIVAGVSIFTFHTIESQCDNMLWYINDTDCADQWRVQPQHTGRYEANFIQSKSSGTSQSLNRDSKCDGTKIIKKIINIGNSKVVKVISDGYLLPRVKDHGKKMEVHQYQGIENGFECLLAFYFHFQIHNHMHCLCRERRY